MNNHKFRAWDDTLLRYLPPMTVEEIGKCNMNGTNWYQLTLEQWTGLCDKNGVEIYEGDKVKAEVYKKIKLSEDEDFFGSDGYKRELSNEEWTVEYKERFNQGNGFYCYGKNRRFNTKLTGSKILNCKLEVIGNIHEGGIL